VAARSRENTGETPVLRKMPVAARSREKSSIGVPPVAARSRENTGETPVLLETPVAARSRENTGETPVLRKMPVGPRSHENTGETPVLLPCHTTKYPHEVCSIMCCMVVVSIFRCCKLYSSFAYCTYRNYGIGELSIPLGSCRFNIFASSFRLLTGSLHAKSSQI